MMNNAYQNLQGLITSFTRSAAGAEKIFSLFDSKPDIDPSKGDDITWDINGEIELRNVQFFYQMRPDNIVLEKFNLYIPAGKTTALVGPSGGGKSTIINLLLRFYDVKDGQVLLDGRDYKSLKVSQLRNLFGVVTQETELFSTTGEIASLVFFFLCHEINKTKFSFSNFIAFVVEENIAYGLNKDEYTTEGLIEASKKAQAFDFISAMKDGFQTRIGERGNRLSGGQRQRLAIARIFLRKPKIILLDEATSALDENSQRGVQDALDILITESKATVIVVAHRLSTVKNADNIVVIEGGLALEQGTHNELIALNGVYTSMVTKQEERIANELEIESIFL